MKNTKDLIYLLLCYVFWGFQPLYWSFLDHIDSYTTLACRIVMSAVFSVLILALTGRTGELTRTFRDKKTMSRLLPAALFLFGDWAIFILAVNAGHVLDMSLGYYINPLLLFAFGVVVYKEKCTGVQLAALGVAAVGVAISTIAFGSFPWLSLAVGLNWAVYATIKKNVTLDGVVSIAAETLLMAPFALAFLLIFRRADLASFTLSDTLFMLGTGVVTALPMFLYCRSVSRFPLIVMCFAQYLSPTFNLICGFIRGESFTKSQLVSIAFFALAIVIFTVSEVRRETEK